jgi:hypothetical protein
MSVKPAVALMMSLQTGVNNMEPRVKKYFFSDTEYATLNLENGKLELFAGGRGITYPPEYVIQLLSFLEGNEFNIVWAMGADTPSNKTERNAEEFYPGSESYVEIMGLDDQEPPIDNDWGSENLDQQEWNDFGNEED